MIQNITVEISIPLQIPKCIQNITRITSQIMICNIPIRINQIGSISRLFRHHRLKLIAILVI